MGLIDLLKKQQSISNDISDAAEEVQLPEKTPVNAVAATVDVEASEIAVMNNDDTIVFQGETFTKAGSTTAASGEFADAAGLTAGVNELLGDDWTAATDTDVTITSDTKGAYYNGLPLVGSIVEGTTAGGGASAKSSVTVAGATVTEMQEGDTIEFDGNTFTNVDSGPGDNEFSSLAELTALFHGLDDWTASDDGTDITVTAAENGDNDGLDVDVTLLRETADGVSGTIGKEGEVCADDDNIYVAKADNKSTDANWLKVSVGTF